MRRLRFAARGSFRPLILIPILLAAAAAALPAAGAPKGKLVLAWHAGFASRWLDPQ